MMWSQQEPPCRKLPTACCKLRAFAFLWLRLHLPCRPFPSPENSRFFVIDEASIFTSFWGFIVLLFVQCAKRGNPTGGPKDETPPVLLRADPELNTTHFNEERIRLYFDEYVNSKS